MNWPLTKRGEGGGAESKKTMTCSKDSHDAEVLNCQQRCDNDAIKGS